jgi:hypothetical protein
MLSTAYYRNGNVEEARSAAAHLQQFAATTEEKRIAEQLNGLVNAR